jgi:hypothetical protein
MADTMTRDEFWTAASFPSDPAGNLLISPAMKRDEYESECERLNVPALSDDEIATRDRQGWYGLGYSLPNFGYSEEIRVCYVRSVLDDARAWGIKVERGQYTVETTISSDPKVRPSVRYIPTRRPTVAQVVPENWGSCDLCGMSVQRSMLMTSPRGSVCPDCYDEAES